MVGFRVTSCLKGPDSCIDTAANQTLRDEQIVIQHIHLSHHMASPQISVQQKRPRFVPGLSFCSYFPEDMFAILPYECAHCRICLMWALKAHSTGRRQHSWVAIVPCCLLVFKKTQPHPFQIGKCKEEGRGQEHTIHPNCISLYNCPHDLWQWSTEAAAIKLKNNYVQHWYRKSS